MKGIFSKCSMSMLLMYSLTPKCDKSLIKVLIKSFVVL